MILLDDLMNPYRGFQSGGLKILITVLLLYVLQQCLMEKFVNFDWFSHKGKDKRAADYKPAVLGLYGHWLAETRSENPTIIIDNYMELVSLMFIHFYFSFLLDLSKT